MAIEGKLQPGQEYAAEFRAPGWVLSWVEGNREGAERLARYMNVAAGNSGSYEVLRVEVGPGAEAPEVERLRVIFRYHGEAVAVEEAGIGRIVMWAAGLLGLTGLLLVGIYAVGGDGPLARGAQRVTWLLVAGVAAWVVLRWG